MISYIGLKSQQCRRMARRLGIFFHIDEFNYFIEHAGWRSEERPATEIELTTWKRLIPYGWKSGDTLSLIRKELDSTYPRAGDHYYIGPDDFACIMSFLEDDLEARSDRSSVVFFYRGAEFHVTSLIPHGCYFRSSTPVPELEVAKDLDLQLENRVNIGLQTW